MADPERVREMLGGLGPAVARRLSSEDLPLASSAPVALDVTESIAMVPHPEADPARTVVSTIAREDESESLRSGFLFIGVEEGRFDSFFWGFVGPTEERYRGNFEQLGRSEKLRKVVWEIQDEIPARNMLRWFGMPVGGRGQFVEIESMGMLGSQLGDWSSRFAPASVLMDLPAHLLSVDSQRTLPQLIGADLGRLLPLLRISLGLPAIAPNQEKNEYPAQIADRRRQVPLIFISYSREDDRPEGKGEVSQLYQALQRRQPGVTFLDSRHLKAGDKWRNLLNSRLSQTAVLVVVVSPRSLQSDEVRLEFTQFAKMLSEGEWPGIVVPIPLDADSFEFFRMKHEGDFSPWWVKSGSLDQDDASEVGLATFNFETESLAELGPDQAAVRLLGIYSQHRDAVQERLSAGFR